MEPKLQKNPGTCPGWIARSSSLWLLHCWRRLITDHPAKNPRAAESGPAIVATVPFSIDFRLRLLFYWFSAIPMVRPMLLSTCTKVTYKPNKILFIPFDTWFTLMQRPAWWRSPIYQKIFPAQLHREYFSQGKGASYSPNDPRRDPRNCPRKCSNDCKTSILNRFKDDAYSFDWFSAIPNEVLH